MPATGEIANPTSDASDGRAGQQMRAIVQDRFGNADVLEMRTIARPEIAPTEVLIEVHAAGLDRGVAHLVSGTPYLIRLAGYGVRKPKHPVPGSDVAGRVVAAGAQVTRFRPGDEVFGIAKGSYAEYAAADQHKLVHKPAHVTFEQAGVVAVSGTTALQALTDVGKLEPGQHVLVIGASGGVGTYAVQLAKALGGTVTGVCSTAKVDTVRSIGADSVVDYTTNDFVDGTRYDLIIDIGGRNSLRRLRRALTPTGTLVITGGEGGGRWTGGFIERRVGAAMLSLLGRQRLKGFIGNEHHTMIERLTEHLVSGAVVPVVGKTFDLEQVPDAIRELAAGRITGKASVAIRAN
jgi:NADPH:quinone reductase-like Zn-dependent oxidoreductase